MCQLTNLKSRLSVNLYNISHFYLFSYSFVIILILFIELARGFTRHTDLACPLLVNSARCTTRRISVIYFVIVNIINIISTVCPCMGCSSYTSHHSFTKYLWCYCVAYVIACLATVHGYSSVGETANSSAACAHFHS